MKLAALALALCACSTTYRVAQKDIARIAQEGAVIQNVATDEKEPIDFGAYHFVYRSKDDKSPRLVKGVESLNALIGAGKLTQLTGLDVVPGLSDRAWQRTLLGGGVGLAAGVGIGFAISNRVIIERTALNGGTYAQGPALIAVGTVVSGVVAAAIGAIVAYFGGAGVGSVRDANVDLLGGSGSQPTSEPATQAASQPSE